MSFIDKAKAKVEDLVDKHGDKVGDGLDKGAAAVNERTHGKYAQKIEGGVQKAKDALDKLDGKNDDIS